MSLSAKFRRWRPDDLRVPSACGLSGFINRSGDRVTGDAIIESMRVIRERGNGLGGGFAGYGIYPDFKDHYALHVMFEDEESREACEVLLRGRLEIAREEPIPTRDVPGICDPPILWRYFCRPREELEVSAKPEEDVLVDLVMDINMNVPGAFVFSSGKNMGVFKAVGFAEEVGEFYRLSEYSGYMWIGHSRFPTNTPGWWGGAHPFNILDWSVVHNGEISSYGTNKRYLEMFGYHCTLLTDTEVMAYLFDLLIRKHGLPLEVACSAIAGPFWRDIDAMESEEERRLYETLRVTYAGALVNGPFAVIVGFNGGMIGLNDRIKLRPLVAAEDGEFLYVSSEEAAIRQICPRPEMVWAPPAGKPVIGLMEK